MKKYPSVEAYVADFPVHIQEKLEQLRAMVKAAAPAAEEGITYGMPVYMLHYKLVWFGAYAKHLAFYPEAGPVAKFAEELKPYKTGKGTVQFPFTEDLPLELLAQMVKFKVKENMERARVEGKIT
ncbi:MAG: iron chaperone [Saprospiraceae bacterium]